MDLLKQWNDALRYLERNLCEEIDLDEAARIACVSKDSFLRFFSYMTGMTVTEYVRRRRLTLAAYELQQTEIRILDLAVKYQYESADAFSRAFFRQHGVTPTQARGRVGSLNSYSAVSFRIQIEGASAMNVKIVQSEEIRLQGISRKFTGDAENRFEQEHIMWADQCDAVYRRVCGQVSGKWYAVWDCGVYSINRQAGETDMPELEETVIPAGLYAVFTSGFGGYAGIELPELRRAAFDSWFKESGYEPAGDYEVEVYHLYPREERDKRQYELWIPLKEKESKEF